LTKNLTLEYTLCFANNYQLQFMRILIIHIKGLLQAFDQQPALRRGKTLQEIPCLSNAFLLIENGNIIDFGKMENLPVGSRAGATVIDGTNRFVMPTFVDSHTHIVFAGSREGEFVDKIKGLTYEQIAEKGGGILNSAKKLQATDEDELFEAAYQRLQEVISTGTGAIEIKSGYGLTPQDEIKMLRVIKRLKKVVPIAIRATFLGAHAIPKELSREAYISQIIEEMLPQVAAEQLADYCDVFCDKGFFTVEETDQLLTAAKSFGLLPKIHANELAVSGGVQVGIKHQALSVDHLERIGDEEIACLQNSSTLPVVLPGTVFFLGLPKPPVRQMIEAGLPLVIASDYNPGSCPSGNMPLTIALACIQLKMTPEEALNAATINAAYALGLETTHGHIRKGIAANVLLTKEMPNYEFMPYSFGTNLVEQVIINGKVRQM
jgi:imidazolonepropionase